MGANIRYYKLRGNRGKFHLAVEVEPDILADLTSIDPELDDIGILALTASLSNSTIDALTKIVLESATPIDIPFPKSSKTPRTAMVNCC